MKLAVIGSRHWQSVTRVFAELDAIHFATPLTCLIHGGAAGADAIADTWADARDVVVVLVRPVDVARKGGDYLKRNSVIVDLADAVLAFRAAGKSNGTDYGIAKALDAGKLLRVAEGE